MDLLPPATADHSARPRAGPQWGPPMPGANAGEEASQVAVPCWRLAGAPRTSRPSSPPRGPSAGSRARNPRAGPGPAPRPAPGCRIRSVPRVDAGSPRGADVRPEDAGSAATGRGVLRRTCCRDPSGRPRAGAPARGSSERFAASRRRGPPARSGNNGHHLAWRNSDSETSYCQYIRRETAIRPPSPLHNVLRASSATGSVVDPTNGQRSPRIMPRVFAAILLIAVLVVGGGIIATTAYQAGLSTAVTTPTTAPGTAVAPVVVPAYGYGWGWGWHPFFGFFGFFIGLFFLFIVFGLIRAIFWRGRWGRGGGWGDGSRPGSGRSGWESRAHETFDDWHRRAHEPASPPPTPTDRAPGT